MKFCLLLFTLLTVVAHAQTGLRGTVKNAQGDVLPYAAVIIKGTPSGTITNDEGRYEIALAPGSYDVVFQFLGFQALQKPAVISAGYATLDVVLEEQAFRLAEVQAKAGNEDPAYTIMRRAIAKSRFHQLQVQQFRARVYTKSSATITDLPNLAEMAFRKQLKEAERDFNFKVGVPILNENVSEVSFTQPNTYRQKVIANRNSQGDFLNPSRFFNVSFYSPTVSDVVSPLSPKAFAYYKFEYKGTFREQGPNGVPVEISKIQVIPRQYGEGVFRGSIFIIENTWAIHSLQLETVNNIGLSFTIRHVCSPVKGVWMPTNQRYNVAGSYLGVKGHGQYVRSITFNEFVVNPAFVEDIQVADEKKGPPAETLAKRDIKGKQLEDLVKKQKEFSTRNLRQMVKEYEKQEKLARKNRKEDVTVVRDDSLVIDSLAQKRSNVFWDSLRSVPLTNAEVKSYQKNDSLKIARTVDKVKIDGTGKRDTTRKAPNRFSPGQLLSGKTWNLNKQTALIYTSPLTRIEYNTVEGYSAEGALNLRYRAKVDSISRFRQIPLGEWNIGGTGRYQLGRKQLVGFGLASYQHKNTKVSLSGGRYLYQFNPENPISPLLNTLTTLLFEQNFAKLYQKDFVNLTITASPFNERLVLTGSIEQAQRTELVNFKENIKPWINWRNRTFAPNRPGNAELTGAESTGFPRHQATILDLTAAGRLGATQYTIRNGRRTARRDNDSPLLTVNYRKGMGDVDYDFLQASIAHSFETGIRSRLNYKLAGGAFLNDNKLYFPDFKHFAGNEFFLQQGDVVSGFRLLPYYQYSTGKRFAEAHVLAEFRKLLITQLTLVRLTGLKENVFVQYLYTPASKNYTEVGYGLDGLIPQVLPFFRVEVISQWQDARYKGLGFRIGTTLKFGR